MPNSFEFIYLQLMAGIVSILSVLQMYKRAQLFLSAAKIIGISFIGSFVIIWPMTYFQDKEKFEFLKICVTILIIFSAYNLIVGIYLLSGWEDPLLITLEGLKNKGYSANILKLFCENFDLEILEN